MVEETVDSYDKPRQFCQNGLSLDACRNRADEDLVLAKNNLPEDQYQGVLSDYGHQRRNKECHCMASWVALYNFKVARV